MKIYLLSFSTSPGSIFNRFAIVFISFSKASIAISIPAFLVTNSTQPCPRDVNSSPACI
uniref:Candidate secreted effector n=1 Tax=Meloidogyne incognita TaxID=6306 RepID=A0A914KM87_MELIC